jgi:hypothetical protein
MLGGRRCFGAACLSGTSGMSSFHTLCRLSKKDGETFSSPIDKLPGNKERYGSEVDFGGRSTFLFAACGSKPRLSRFFGVFAAGCKSLEKHFAIIL